jgi:hypothetical protein
MKGTKTMTWVRKTLNLKAEQWAKLEEIASGAGRAGWHDLIKGLANEEVGLSAWDNGVKLRKRADRPITTIAEARGVVGALSEQLPPSTPEQVERTKGFLTIGEDKYPIRVVVENGARAEGEGKESLAELGHPNALTNILPEPVVNANVRPKQPKDKIAAIVADRWAPTAKVMKGSSLLPPVVRPKGWIDPFA